MSNNFHLEKNFYPIKMMRVYKIDHHQYQWVINKDQVNTASVDNRSKSKSLQRKQGIRIQI